MVNDRGPRLRYRTGRGRGRTPFHPRTARRFRWVEARRRANEIDDRCIGSRIPNGRRLVGRGTPTRRHDFVAPYRATMIANPRRRAMISDRLHREILIVPALGPPGAVFPVHDDDLRGSTIVHVRGPRDYRWKGNRRIRGVDTVVVATAVLRSDVAHASAGWHPLLTEPDPVLVVPVPTAFEPHPARSGRRCQGVDSLPWSTIRPRLAYGGRIGVLDTRGSFARGLAVAGGKGDEGEG